MLVYDVEIEKAILGRNDTPEPDIEYCEGWNDHANMGVAVICAYDYITDAFRVFTLGQFDDFAELAAKRFVVGFNSARFDDVVCGHVGIEVTTDYDVLQHIWLGLGLDPNNFVPATHGGLGLDAMAEMNFKLRKSGYGGTAPIWWQRGEYGRTIDYCLHDVKLTRRLLDRIIKSGELLNPKPPHDPIKIARPH